MEIELNEIEKHFSALAKIGNLGSKPEEGFLRASWSDEETAAINYIADVAKENGLQVRSDAVGNCFIATPGDYEKIIQIGSHLDTVPRGGNYDGAVGIVCGLLAIIANWNANQNLEKGLELVIWRGEESGTFDQVYKGSRAAFGLLKREALDSTFQGKTLRSAMLSQDCDPSFVERGEPTIKQNEIDKVVAHFEIHIEQSVRLEKDNLDIGICNSIRGATRMQIVVKGKAAHSGGTPMGVKYRSDANLASAHMQVELNEFLNNRISSGADLVLTVGVCNSSQDFNEKNPAIYESAITKVSELAYFTLDIRSNNEETLKAFGQDSKRIIENVGARFNVECEIEQISYSKPIEQLDKDLQLLCSAVCEELGYSSQLMPSGAGHDIAVVAEQKRSDGTKIPCQLLFIPCREGISHNPKEYSSPEQIQKGAMVLAHAISARLRS
jgi:hydantoinase/carbamoylase family amidase